MTQAPTPLPNPNDLKYPEWTLAVDTSYAKKVLAAFSLSSLAPLPMWAFLDGGGENLWEEPHQKPNSARINAHLTIRQRQALEKNEDALQILPYTLFGYADAEGNFALSTYARKKGAGEERLDGAASIGWGGHPDLVDLAWKDNNDLDLIATLDNNIRREGAEEIIFTDSETGREVDINGLIDACLRPLGVIYDTENSVGRTHLAIVNLVIIPNHIVIEKRENCHLEGPVKTVLELAADLAAYEPWSKIVIEALAEGITNVRTNRDVLESARQELGARLADPDRLRKHEQELSAGLANGSAPL